MAGKNTLKIGEYRYGRLYDRYPNTPDISAVLHDDGKYVRLTLNLLPEIHSAYLPWFIEKVDAYGNKEISSTPLPNRLWFSDERGEVALIECHSAGFRWSDSVFTGVIQAQKLVFATARDVDFHKINGLRTTLSGMGIFFECAPPNDLNLIRGKLDNQIGNSRKLDTRYNQSFIEINKTSIETTGATWQISPQRFFQTSRSSKANWNEHLLLASDLQELMIVASGQKISVLNQEVLVNSPKGATSGAAWNQVYTGVSSDDSVSSQGWFFHFDDLPKGAMHRWHELRKLYGTGLQPYLKLISNEIRDVEVQVMLIGIAIEGLGYEILNRSRETKKISEFAAYTKALADDLEVSLPIEIKKWKQSMRKTYIAVKHADQESPDFLDLLEIRRLSLIIIRVWVAKKLGVPDAVILRNLHNSNQLQPYTYVENKVEPKRKRTKS